MAGKMMKTSSSVENILTKRQRIAELARIVPKMELTTLAHHMDMAWMQEAYRRTRKDGATGVDGDTAAKFARSLGDNLQDLIDAAKSGRYRAPPVRRAYIPKAGGKQRPIGVPTFGDKVLQRAVVMLIEPIYEVDFRNCSYGYRPGRSAHQALDALWKGAMDLRGGWVLEIDIESFFDTIDHHHLQAMLRQRIRDGVVLRLIGKWLKAGIMENGQFRQPDTGSPQGGVISPLLANIYLHGVLDTWFHDEVQPCLRGRSYLVRYADDAVLGFEREEDAREVLAALHERFARYGLKLHPDKTRLICFQRPVGRAQPRTQRPRTSFDFLGFRMFWAKSLRGFWVILRKTASDRFSRSLRSIKEWCRRNRHLDLKLQQETLSRKMQGHYNYFGIRGNFRALSRFRYEVRRIWRKWLSRRSQRGRIPWEKWQLLEARYPLPQPRLRKQFK